MQLNKRKKIIINYFEYFNNQDLLNLSKIFSNKIRLKDWEIDVIGKKNVIKANKDIFNKFPRINVKIIEIHFSKDDIFAIIKVKLDKQKTIEVIDKFKINKRNQIKEIKAYLG